MNTLTKKQLIKLLNDTIVYNTKLLKLLKLYNNDNNSNLRRYINDTLKNVLNIKQPFNFDFYISDNKIFFVGASEFLNFTITIKKGNKSNDIKELFDAYKNHSISY